MAKVENKTKIINQIGAEIGKVPPNVLKIEESVLGALLLEKEAINTVIDYLKPEAFYKDAHQKIFQAIIDLSSENEPVDLLTVTEKLKQNKALEDVGGEYYISQLTLYVGSIAHLEHHAKTIAQKYIQRELIRVSSEIQRMAFDESTDIVELIDFSENEMYKIAEGNIKKQTSKIKDVVVDALAEIEAAAKNTDGLSGVPSGFTDLDRLTSGWQKSDLIILAARPSMGKTAFALNMARNIAVDHKRSVAIFSLEMSSVQLVKRLISTETELQQEKLRNGKLAPHEWQQLESRLPRLAEAQMFIDDTPGLTVFELRAKCRRLAKEKHGLDIIIIDYLQLMNGSGQQSREQEVSVISRSLKGLAKELNVPVIALSQLNRSVTMRQGEKRPQLSDLRESGAIEQDADMVCFIHRPEMLGIEEDSEGMSTKGMAEIVVAKHRNGALSDIKLRFQGEFARFLDYNNEGMPDISGLSETGGMVLGSKMNEDDSNSESTSVPKSDYKFNDQTPF